MKDIELELYSDFLMSNFGAATATGLSTMLDGEVSHDKITRLLSSHTFDSKELWLKVKSTVRQIEQEDGVLIFDDTIQEKAWTDENALVCWHFDHVKGRMVKGMNLLNGLYHSKGISVPVAFELVKKPYVYCDIQTRKEKRLSDKTKNTMMREMIKTCVSNALKFRYVLMDSWFSAKENFEFIRKKKKHFIAALKSNRLVALSEADKKQGRFVRIDSLDLSEKVPVSGWLKGYSEEVLLTQQVFTNKNGSIGKLHLVCSDLSCDGDTIKTTYQKRWEVEVFHKSLKSNAGLAKSPTRRVRTQSNHVFMSIYAVFKLECLKLKHKTNHFALRMKLLAKANRLAYNELKILQSA